MLAHKFIGYLWTMDTYGTDPTNEPLNLKMLIHMQQTGRMNP